MFCGAKVVIFSLTSKSFARNFQNALILTFYTMFYFTLIYPIIIHSQEFCFNSVSLISLRSKSS